MNERPDYDARLSAVEGRLDAVESEASAARHLAAFNDRDLADLGIKVEANRRAINTLGVKVDANRRAINTLGVKVDANRRAINALGQQTAEQFADVRSEMRAGFAATRAGFDAIGAKLDQLIDTDDPHR